MNEKIRVGIVGLGEVAQTIHIPVLQHLSDKYTITAVCDLSKQLLDGINYIPTVKIKCNDYNKLVESPDVDLVFVINNGAYHTETAIAALKAGKDVFVEKPLGVSIPDVTKLKAIQEECKKLIFVGYMRRFAPAFIALKNDLPNLGKPLYVKSRDIIGTNNYFNKQAHNVIYPDDIPDEKKRERQEKNENFVKEAIGEASQEVKNAYMLLLGLGVHDLSLVRELFGMPKSVQSAEVWKDGNFIRATLDYGDFKVAYDTGVVPHGIFDAQLEVIGENGIGTVYFDNPYLRNLPVHYERKITKGYEFSVEKIRPTYTDPFAAELEHLYDHIKNRTEPKTNIADSIEDLKLIKAIITAVQNKKETDL